VNEWMSKEEVRFRVGFWLGFGWVLVRVGSGWPGLCWVGCGQIGLAMVKLGWLGLGWVKVRFG
jgi:hypothetical protein